MRALDRKLLRDLWRLKGQALAIGLVIGGGIAIFILSLGTLRSLEEARSTYYERYRFADVFVHLKRAPWSLAARIAEIPGVAHVEPRIVFDVTLEIPGFNQPARARLISVPGTHRPILNDLHLRRGRFLDPGRVDEAVVSEALAEAHGLSPGDSLSAIINGHWRRLDVVGVALSPEFVYSIPPGAMLPDDKRFGILWMGHGALEAATDLDGAFNDVTLSLMASADEREVIARVDDLLRPYGGLGAYGREDQLSEWFIAGELEELRVFALVSPAIFLGVAAFLLNIVMARLIVTEREEIGTLKACGYSNRQVGLHYLKMTLAIVALGALLGSAAGAWLGLEMTELYTRFFRFPVLEYRLTPGILVGASLISAAAAIAGTLGAVRQAVALSPAEAMRPEVSLSFRRSLIERLGIERALPHTTRMILRYIERRPLRSIMSCLGIATAVAVLIASLFALDSIDYIMDVEFNIAHREDISVSFVEPRSRRALREIGHLPGVLAAEPFRAVPVRLRAGPRSERTALLGLAPGSALHRMIDADLEPIPVPDHGLMLSDKLAELLEIGPGREVLVEVLEGRRPVRALRVAGLVEDYLGTTAFLALPELNRLMLEDRVISGVRLLVDASRREELFRRLQDLPGVGSIAITEAALEAFRKTLAETMTKMIVMNVLFASLIAVGVVYNAARIALSERGRELASLSLLGFSRWEVSSILLGELALLTVAAIPIGCGLGYGLAWLITLGLDRDVYRIPLVIEPSTYGQAILVVLTAAAGSALIVRRRVERMDMVAVLKTRE